MNYLCFKRTRDLVLGGLIFSLLMFAGCISGELSSDEKDPFQKEKRYSSSEIDTINQKFQSNPIQYSQQYGELILWKIFQEHPKFSSKLAEIPEVRDDISFQEVEALKRIYLLTIDTDSRKRSTKKDQQVVGRSAFLDKIQNKGTESLRDLFLFCMTNQDNDLFSEYHKDITRRKKERLGRISQFNQRLASELKLLPEVRQANEFSIIEALDDLLYLMKSSTSKNMKNLNDYFRVGMPEHRKFCTPIQALVWLAEDGEFSESYNPLNDSWFKTVKKAWGNMKGARWNNKPDDARQRLNHPIFTNYWLRKNMLYRKARNYTFDEIYEAKSGDCRDFADFSTTALFASGWNAYKLKVRWQLPTWYHWVSILRIDHLDSNIIYGFFDYKEIEKRLAETKKPLYWIVADGGGKGTYPIRGPFKDYRSIAIRIVKDYGTTFSYYRPVF